METLTSHSFVGVTPFDGDPGDLAASLHRMAFSLSIVLSNHITDSSTFDDVGSRPVHLAGAIDAMTHLIALADLATDVALRVARRDASK